MVITMTGEYALRAAIHLARHHPMPKTSAEIARATQVPPSYLSKIMQMLVKGHVAQSQRGSGGGFQLANSPCKITVMDVLDAAGSPTHRTHLNAGHGNSDLNPLSLQRLVDHAADLIESTFSCASLAGLLQEVEGDSARDSSDGWLDSSDPCDPWPVPESEVPRP